MRVIQRDVECASGLARGLAASQAVFYVATGLWPIVHLPSFEKITGPKPEGWLVKTVGALITVIGGTVGWSWWRKRMTPEVRFLAAGAALSLAAVDVIYTAKRRISPVYLLDVLPELAIAGGWALDGWRSIVRNAPRPNPVATPEPLSW